MGVRKKESGSNDSNRRGKNVTNAREKSQGTKVKPWVY